MTYLLTFGDTAWLAVNLFFFYPGNMALWLLLEAEIEMAQAMVAVFEISSRWHNGWTAGTISSVCWLALIIVLANILARFRAWIESLRYRPS